MQDDCIAVALGLPQLSILGQQELEDRFEVTVMYRREKVPCSGCGGVWVKEHARSAQRKQDRKIRDKKVFLMLLKRRFRCLSCGKVFTEPDEVFEARKRSSKRLREYLGRQAMYQPIRRLAREEKVSESLVRRCFTEEAASLLGAEEGKPRGARVIGLDEYSVKRRVYDTAICDLEERRILGLVTGRGKDRLEEHFDHLSNPEVVEVVVMDMHEPYRQAVQMCLPRVDIVVDKFHVIRKANEALDKVRTRLQGKEVKGRRGFLFHHRYLLLRGAETLNQGEQRKLAELLGRYRELGRAWALKESLRHWYREGNRQEAESHLLIWEDSIHKQGPREFESLLSMFKNWREEILNYFKHRVTNGFVEGKNNRIKVIKRMAYGYRNIDNFRRRILLSNNSIAANPRLTGGHHTY